MTFHSVKVFKAPRDVALHELVPMLRGREFSREWLNPEIGQKVMLVTSIDSVEYVERTNFVKGVLKDDSPIVRKDRHGLTKTIIEVVEVPFAFCEGSLYFLPMADRKTADNAANIVGRLLFGSDMLKMFFSTEQIRLFLASHAYDMTLCNWKELGLPGTSNVQLNGPEIRDNPDYPRYRSIGKEKRVRITLHSNGWSIGLSEEGIITFYTDVEENTAYSFVKDKIIPLFLQRNP